MRFILRRYLLTGVINNHVTPTEHRSGTTLIKLWVRRFASNPYSKSDSNSIVVIQLVTGLRSCTLIATPLKIMLRIIYVTHPKILYSK